ncbi:MAG: hypothetical protein IK140_10150, partial [Clostridia bacterium]|nr:hypothetical protein [Clostridia bacterium]
FEGVVGDVDQALGLSGAFVAGDNLNHIKSLRSMMIWSFCLYYTPHPGKMQELVPPRLRQGKTGWAQG